MNGPEVYGVIFSVGPGKRDINVIWTGSDDGLVHVTRDGGKTWTNVTPKDMPDFGRVSQIDASNFNAGAAYVSVRRPLLDDRAPYIFKTTDYGKTWTKIVNGIRADAYVHAVREDPTRKGLLYAATQHGVYISYDDGAPLAEPHAQHARRAGGRPGRRSQRTGDRLARPRLLGARQHRAAASGDAGRSSRPTRTSTRRPAAVRSGTGATISYIFKTAPKRAVLEILDSTGAVLRKFEADTRTPAQRAAQAPAGGGRRGGAPALLPIAAGMQSRSRGTCASSRIPSFPGMILWGAGTNGPAVPPGTYTARLIADGATMTHRSWSSAIRGCPT